MNVRLQLRIALFLTLFRSIADASERETAANGKYEDGTGG